MINKDDNIKPSVLPSIYNIEQRLKNVGLSRNDLVTLLVRDTRLSRTIINKTLIALQKIENNMIKATNYER